MRVGQWILLPILGLVSACGGGGGGGGDGGGSGPQPVHSSLQFEMQAIDLDTGAVVNALPASPGSFPGSAWDFYFAHNGARPIHAVMFQNTGTAQISHLLGRTFDSVTYADVAGATFSSTLVDEPFDANRTVLVRIASGAVFKVGNASEDATTVSFDTQLLVP